MKGFSHYLYVVVLALIAGCTFYSTVRSNKRNNRLPKNQQATSRAEGLPAIDNEADLRKYIESLYPVVFPVSYTITDSTPPLYHLPRRTHPTGLGFMFHNPHEQTICVAYVWPDSTSMIDKWPVEGATLKIMTARDTKLPHRICITAFLKNEPLSIEPAQGTTIEQLITWLTSLPFKKITEKQELI